MSGLKQQVDLHDAFLVEKHRNQMQKQLALEKGEVLRLRFESPGRWRREAHG